MAIIAKNIKVGVDKVPTKPKEIEPVQSLAEVKQVFVEGVKKASVEKPEKPSKYIKKSEGELVKHINIKSSYQKDMLEL